MQMRPSQFVSDSANLGLADVVLRGYNFLRAFIVVNGFYLLGCKFGGRALLTAIRSGVFHPVSLIGARRVPAKIGEAIVRQVAIVVATLKSWWWRSTKSHQNQSANATHLVDAVFPEKQEMATVLLVNGQFFDVSGFRGPNTTSIRDFIDTFKSDNVFPLFHKFSVSQDMGIVARGAH